jgi:alpha-D-xyloside xylohydrolase
MQISWLLDGRESVVRGRRIGLHFVRKSLRLALGSLLLALWPGGRAMAQGDSLLLQRDGRIISLVPYAPNIVRVTISTDAAAGASDPRYGFVGKPSAEGWTHERDAKGDIFRSARMVVRVSPENQPDDELPKPMPLDALNSRLREVYFGGGGGHRPHNDSLLVTTAEGKTLLHMRGWIMTPERPEVAELDSGAKDNRVAAVFDSRAEEHYYGLGQQQQGWMDLRDHEIRCWHDYGAIGGEDV